MRPIRIGAVLYVLTAALLLQWLPENAHACPTDTELEQRLQQARSRTLSTDPQAKALWEDLIVDVRTCPDYAIEDRVLIAWVSAAMAHRDLTAAGHAENQRYELADRVKSTPMRADAARKLGVLAFNSGDHSTSQARLEEAAKLFEQMHAFLEAADAYSYLSRLHRRRGEFVAALAAEKASLALRRRLDSNPELWRSLRNIALLYEELEQFDEARKGYAEALADVQRTGNVFDQSAVLASFAGFLNDFGASDAKQASGYAEDALRLAREAAQLEKFSPKTRQQIATALLQKGRAAFNLGDLGGADTALSEALTLVEALNHRMMRAHVLMRWGEVALAGGQAQLALERVEQARTAYAEQKNRHRLIKTYALLERIYQQLGDPLKAAQSGLEHYRLRDELLGGAALARIGEMLGRFEQNEDRLRAERLAQETQVAQLALSNQQQKFQTFLMAVLAFLGISSLFAWRHFTVERLYRSLRERNATVQAQAEQLATANAQLTAQAQSLELASRAKSQFVANMSHEIRTPMNAVIGTANLLARSPLNARQQGLLGQLTGSARLLLGVINDVLDLSRIEAGKLRIEQREFRLNDVLTDVSTVLGERARGKGLDLLFVVADDVPPVLIGDAVRLQQVLINLAGNALKFTEQGQVLVEISSEQCDQTHTLLRAKVSDSGIGIAPDDLARLFEAFTQVDESNTRAHGGVGLGLAICKRLTELMGGEIGVRSEPGQGSQFWFTARFGIAPASATRPALVHGLHALVVDDNAVTREVFSRMLESLRFEVSQADSAEAAIACLSGREHFDLLVLDWKLPGMNGIEAVRELHRRGVQPPAVVMVTAYGGEELMREAHAAGITVFLHKPVSPSTLYDAALQALGLPAIRSSEGAPGRRVVVPVHGDVHVLLVEDNEINRMVASESLAALGVRVTTANSGLQALELLVETRFHLIFMDIQMPGLDGIETTRRIRQLEGAAQTPIVALTAHAMVGDRQRFLDAGMDDYLAKPLEEAELAGVLSRWLPTATPVVASAPAAPIAPDDHPGLDLAAALARVNGKTALLWRLIGDFRCQHADAVTRLRSQIEAQQWSEASALAHTLKGSAATLGLRQVVAAAVRLESGLRNGNLEALLQLEPLESALADLKSLQLPEAVSSDPSVPAIALAEACRQLAAALARNSLSAREDFKRLLASAEPASHPSLRQIGEHIAALQYAEAARLLAQQPFFQADHSQPEPNQ